MAEIAAMTGTDVATYTRDRPGMSAFAFKDGAVHHTYSTYARGLDSLWGIYQWLDRAPKGRKKRASGGTATTSTSARQAGGVCMPVRQRTRAAPPLHAHEAPEGRPARHLPPKLAHLYWRASCIGEHHGQAAPGVPGLLGAHDDPELGSAASLSQPVGSSRRHCTPSGANTRSTVPPNS